MANNVPILTQGAPGPNQGVPNNTVVSGNTVGTNVQTSTSNAPQYGVAPNGTPYGSPGSNNPNPNPNVGANSTSIAGATSNSNVASTMGPGTNGYPALPTAPAAT